MIVRARRKSRVASAAFTGLTQLLLSVDHRLIGNVNEYDDVGLRQPPKR
jgi:hypothetical protein